MIYSRQLQLGPMQNFVYLLGAEDAREVAVIDPAWEVEAILAAAERDGKEVVAALLTHHHHDHVNGVLPLLERRPGIPVVAQRREIELSSTLQAFGDAMVPVEPGDEISVGPLPIRCLHTPGHTPGSHCFLAGSDLFTGDTLFIGGCGRCDLPGGDPEEMFRSLHQVLGSLPEETRVHPGHDYGSVPVSTLGAERRENPYLQRTNLEEFVSFRMRPRGRPHGR